MDSYCAGPASENDPVIFGVRPVAANAGAAAATPPVMIAASAATVRMIRFIVDPFLCHPGRFALRDGLPHQVAAVAAGDVNREGDCFSAAIRPRLASLDGQSAQQAEPSRPDHAVLAQAGGDRVRNGPASGCGARLTVVQREPTGLS